MTRSTEGVSDEWVDNMLNDHRIRIVHDFTDSALCFPGVDIMGGVNYFLWERDNPGICSYNLHNEKDSFETIIGYLNASGAGIVIRDAKAISIIDKIKKIEGDYISNELNNFSGLVSPKDFFTNKQLLTSSWKGYSVTKTREASIKYYLNKAIHKQDYAWVRLSDIPKNLDSIPINKVYIPAANGSNDIVLGKPFYGEAQSACSQTYLVIGYNPERHSFSEEICKNIITYIQTKFFRYLVSIKKKTQNGPRGVYQFAPLQDFSKPWTDEELYAKYALTQEEIDFIESMIKPME